MSQEIVIVGAGIIGLYTALILSRTGNYKITIYAKHMPGDVSAEYASPDAGGNFSTVSGDDAAALEYDRLSFLQLEKLYYEFGEAAGIERLPAYFLSTEPVTQSKQDSLRSYIPDFKEITDNEYLDKRGAKYGMVFTTFNFNAPFFIKFLYNHLSELGVLFIRKDVKSLKEAFGDSTSAVFNCTGLMAGKLTDDKTIYPVRGQIVVVRAPHISCNMKLIVANQPPTYIIPRPHSGGKVVLGGYYQDGDWTAGTFAEQTKSIIDRTTRLMPELLSNGPLEVLDERAGLRPGRSGGARIESEYIDGNKLVIHNYGAGGTGYQSGIGMCLKAIRLLVPNPHL